MSEQETKSAEELAVSVKAQFDESIGVVREIAEKAHAEAEKGIPMAEAAKELADQALAKMSELSNSVQDMEQRLARHKGGQTEHGQTIGEMFVGSDAFKNADLDSRSMKSSYEAKASLTTLTTDAAGSVGDGADVTRLGLVENARQRLTIRALLSPGKMDGNTLEYPKETGFTNNADVVAEGALKPQSDIQLELVSTSAKVIAHHMKASRQALSDVSQLRSMIDTRLLWGLGYKEEQQILYGDGTGQNLNGIVPQATEYAPPTGITGETAIDKVRFAMLQAALAEYPASGIVLNDTDWAIIETDKDAQGRYIIGNPQGTIGANLWGLPVVATKAITEDKFLVGAFQMGAQIFDRWTARVEVGYENDDFTKNMVTILGEERVALAVYRPEAFIYGDLGRLE